MKGLLDVLNGERNDRRHLLIDLFRHKVGPSFADTVGIVRVRKGFRDLTQDGGDDNEFGPIGKEGAESLEKDDGADGVDLDVGPDCRWGYGGNGSIPGASA